MVCAYPDGRQALTGIVSWGTGCANSFPGIYTDVYRFQAWITQPGNERSNIDEFGRSFFGSTATNTNRIRTLCLIKFAILIYLLK